MSFLAEPEMLLRLRTRFRSGGAAAWLVAILAAYAAVAAEPEGPTGSVVLLDFEDGAQLAGLRAGNYASVQPAPDASPERKLAARITFAPVPEGIRDYPAVVVEGKALKVRDFTPFEAISLWVMNPGPVDADLSLSIWDQDGHRSFPVPSTVTLPPGKWQQVIARLVLHGLDAKRIGSVHLYQKVNRRDITLLVDDVQLLSPYAGRIATKVELVRGNLARARSSAQLLGAEMQVEPKITALAQRLDELQDTSSPLNAASQRTQRLLALAQITMQSQALVGAIGVRSEGKDLRLIGPQVEAGWLSNPEALRRVTALRLLNTPLGDDAFALLAPAKDLETLVIASDRITGAGLDQLAGPMLVRLILGNTAAHDDALKNVGKFQQLQQLELLETDVTSGVLKHLGGLAQLKILRLSGTGVSDTGFSEISKLTALESLELARTKITGQSLRHVANLDKLKSLDLRNTRVDDAGLSFLGKLILLEALLLENTPITGASFGQLGALDNLVELNLNGTRVGDSALQQLGELPTLQRLELSSTRVTDGSLQQIIKSAKLNYLDLYGTNVSDVSLAHLQNQRRLQELYLGGTRASDIGIGYLEKLTELRQLDLDGTQITDACLRHLRGMTNLATLKLGNTRIGGAGLVHLAGLSKLSNLDLSGTGVTDEALGSIARLENLTTLHLNGTRVTSQVLRELQAATKLVELHLEATDVGDEGLEFLTALPNLQRLNLNETAITDKGLTHLKRLERLRSLSLNHTRITDEGLSHLGDSFASLELTHTRISDQGLTHLQRNDQLVDLRLASTGISNDALTLLQAMPSLRRLDLAETNIGDAGLEHLAVLPELQELNLNGTRTSDLGIDVLLKLPGLRRLSLENSRVTSQGASYLKHRLPELELDLVFPWVWGEQWSYYSLPSQRKSSEPPSPTPAILPQIKELTSLGYLHVDESLLTAEVLRSLKDIPTLEHLSFQGAPLADAMLSNLLGLSQVARLDLAETPITDGGLIHLQSMQALRELNLQRTLVTGNGLAHLAPLTRMQALNLRQTSLNDEGLVHISQLTQLRKLELSDTPVTNKGIEHLLKLPNLQYLDLYGTGVTDAGLARLKQMKSLRYCYLSDTAVTDAGIGQLRVLTELEELGLDGTLLTDQGLADLRSLLKLRRLRIGRTRVSDAGLSHVARLPNISRLELCDLPLTDGGIRALHPLSRLQSLDLSGTRVTDEGLDSLAEFPVLSELDVQDTAVTAPAVARFRQEHPEIKVAWGVTRPGYSVWSVAITVVYGMTVLAICFYGIHRYTLAWLFVRDKGSRTSPEPMGQFEDLPAMTVQLPMFNERHVAERIIEAACALDYPRDRFEIQVLDDSTDESANIARRCCERMARAGHAVKYQHRTDRVGFKGGALAAGLESATGEFIAVFDADFVPPADILKRSIHHFTDPRVGMVQTEWSHLNREQSLLTECQAIFLDGHFVVEQTVRSRNHRWFNFNGTAGIWRKRCIQDAGGWQHDTLTEDTDLSYRAQLNGWQFIYLPTVRCSAELPSTVTAFLGQQHRWSKGLIQTGKKLLPRILGSSAPWPIKLEAWFHLTSPLMYLVMFIVTAIALPAMFLATPLTHREVLALTLGLASLGMGTMAAVTFYYVSQRAQGFSAGRTLFKLPVLMALGIGMCAVNARAVLEAMLGFQSPFVRTPKFGGRADCDSEPSVTRRRWRVPAGIVELVMAGVLFACLALSFLRPYTLIGAPFLLLFALGYAGVGWLSLLDRYSVRQKQPRRVVIGWPRPSPARFAVGTLALLLLGCVSGSTLMITSAPAVWARNGVRRPISLGLDLTTAGWHMVGNRQLPAETKGAIKRVYADRGSLVLDVQLGEQADQGEIILDLDGAMQPLGDSLGSSRELTLDVEYPARFTGEFQAFVKDRRHRSEYGSMEFIESHDARRAVTVSLIPDLRVPAMGYQDNGFDPHHGIRQIGLKISAQSDRVRGASYRPFRGTVRVTKVRIHDVDRDAHREPEIRPPAKNKLQTLPSVTAQEFLAASGVDRPWPLGYGFSGPVTAEHLAELERTYAASARLGCSFTRVYVGDYRTGLVVDGNGKTSGVEPAFLDYLDQLAAVANRHGITVMFSLTDNTIADGRGLESVDFIREGGASELFVQNVLAEFVKGLSEREVIWDIFNEPENVTAVPLRDVQRYVDRVLIAGRRADPDARFTVVSRSRPEIVYWQGRGLDLYSHNLFTARSVDEAISGPRALDAEIMVAEMAPDLVSKTNLRALREAGYSGVGIWGWGTEDKYAWDADDLERVTGPLVQNAERARDQQ